MAQTSSTPETYLFGAQLDTCPTCGLAHHGGERIERIVAAGLNGWYALIIRVIHA